MRKKQLTQGRINRGHSHIMLITFEHWKAFPTAKLLLRRFSIFIGILNESRWIFHTQIVLMPHIKCEKIFTFPWVKRDIRCVLLSSLCCSFESFSHLLGKVWKNAVLQRFHWIYSSGSSKNLKSLKKRRSRTEYGSHDEIHELLRLNYVTTYW